MSQRESQDHAPHVEGEVEKVDGDGSDGGSFGEGDGEMSDWEPAYATDDLVEIFVDFYKFLSRLHYDPSGLLLPPDDGWPNITPEKCAGFGKSDVAIEVMRRLPYLVTPGATFNFKSILINYSNKTPAWFASFQEREVSRPGEGHHHVAWDEVEDYKFAIAAGWESGGVDLILDLKEGAFIEEVIRYHGNSYDVKEYFADIKNRYVTLQLMPCGWRESVEPHGLLEEDEEMPGEMTWLEYVTAKKTAPETGLESKLDVLWLKQTYREFGWPTVFRRVDFEAFVNEKMEELERMQSSGEIGDTWCWGAMLGEEDRWEALED